MKDARRSKTDPDYSRALFARSRALWQIALNSVLMIRDPFPLSNPFNLSSDQRTRLKLFVRNLDLLPGEDSSAVTARAERSAEPFPFDRGTR